MVDVLKKRMGGIEEWEEGFYEGKGKERKT
jgi:hypothetical protein